MLRHEADRYKSVGYPQFFAMSSAFCSITGDIDGLRSCCVNVKAHTSDDELICFAAQSLIFSGLFTDAFKILTESRINWSEPGSASTRAYELMRVHAYEKLGRYLEVVKRCKIDLNHEVSEMADTFRMAQDLRIPEIGVRNMLDAAGKTVRARGLSFNQNSVDVIENTLVISIGIKAPADVVAKMEWDYTGEIVENYPDAPIDNVSIVFFSENEEE